MNDTLASLIPPLIILLIGRSVISAQLGKDIEFDEIGGWGFRDAPVLETALKKLGDLTASEVHFLLNVATMDTLGTFGFRSDEPEILCCLNPQIGPTGVDVRQLNWVATSGVRNSTKPPCAPVIARLEAA